MWFSGFEKGRLRLRLHEARKGSASAASKCKPPLLNDHRIFATQSLVTALLKKISGSCCFVLKIQTLKSFLKRVEAWGEVDLWVSGRRRKKG